MIIDSRPSYHVDFNLVDKQNVPVYWEKKLKSKTPTSLMQNLENQV